MMTTSDAVRIGRDSFQRRAWRQAHSRLSTEDAKTPLATEDLELLITAAHLIGQRAEAADLSARAYREGWRARGDRAHAARVAFWLGFHLMLRGRAARGGGWLARAQASSSTRCRTRTVSAGLLLVPIGWEVSRAATSGGVRPGFGRAAEIGDRFADPDLLVLAQMGRGSGTDPAGPKPAGAWRCSTR